MTIREMERLAKKIKWKKVCEEVYETSKDKALDEFMKTHCGVMEQVCDSWAKGTKRWKADICYEIYGILDTIKALEDEGIVSRCEYPVRLIGIRDSGVDHPGFIESRFKAGELREYKDIFMLTITVHEGPVSREVKQTLYKKTA